jgi:hypothetical protein
MRRAVYRDNYKLITVGDEPDELFNVVNDPEELDNLISEKPEVAAELSKLLTEFLAEVETRRPTNWEASRLNLDENEEILDRLRGLGYIE